MSDIIKPMLAKDINFDKLKFPTTGLMLLPKIDGSFAYGMKDTVRMPQFKTIRSERDM